MSNPVNCNPDSDLTAEDMAMYDSLIDPDEHQGEEDHNIAPMEHGPELQRMILGTLLQDLDFAKHYVGLLKPESFRLNTHQDIAKLLWSYVKKYGALPTRQILMAELPKIAKQKDEVFLFDCKVELDVCLKDPSVKMDTRGFIADKIDNEVARITLKNAGLQLAKAIKDPDADLSQAFAKLAAVKMPSRSNGNLGRFLLTVKDARARAALRPQVPFVPNYAEFGALTLLSGQPGCGKSELVIMLIYCSLAGIPFLGMEVPKAHFILFDPENLLTVTIQRMDALFGSDVADGLDHWVTIIDKDDPAYPSPLTPDFVEGIINQLRATIGEDERIVVVIDTFRTAFSGSADYDENGPEFASKMLGALKAIAGRTFVSLWMLHHNNWSGRVSGSTAFRGNADYACEYKREQGTNKAELSWVRGRGCEMQPDLLCVRDPITKHITLTASEPVEDETEKKERWEVYLRNVVVGACPDGEDKAESKGQIYEAVKRNCQFIFDHGTEPKRKLVTIGLKKVKAIVDWLVEAGYLHETDADNPNHTKYYRLGSVDLMAEFYPQTTS
jgi:hypothetical protein